VSIYSGENMKRAISISIGSSKRDKIVEIDLLGERVSLERRGTDGDMEEAARLFGELDGKVDAFGMGGADLGVTVGDRRYPLYSALKIVQNVKHTPIVDGTGLKMTLERQAAAVLEKQIGGYIKDKKVFLLSAVDRWGLTHAFTQAGYYLIVGDMMSALGIPIAFHSESTVKTMAALLLPIVARLPYDWIYPIGEKQEKRTPKWEKYFQQASVIAGDCHYIKCYMPESLEGKVIVTNTTTPEDQALFRKIGVKYLMTTTPVLEGRSFGTNMMEASIIAALGRKEQVDYAHPGSYFQQMEEVIHQLNMVPSIQEL
jgi:hypothetical protein